MIISKLPILNFRIVINLFLLLLPLSFIAGNLLINLNITIIILSSLFYWKKEFFKIKLFFIDKLLIILFLFSIFTGLVNYFNYSSYDIFLAKENVIKTISFLRYLLFYFSVRHIIEKNYFDFKTFFLSSSICVLFVSLDLIFQLYNGSDIFGFPKENFRLSGPFGDEYIAGAYLQRFSLFLLFLIPFLKDKINIQSKIFLFLFLFLLIFFSIIIAGNRMPIILFIISILIFFSLEKDLRKFLFLIIPLIFFGIFTIINFYPHIKDSLDHFLKLSLQILFSFNEIFQDTTLNSSKEYIKDSYFFESNMYLKEFNLGYLTWKENMLIGGGINSFYLNCKINFDICTSHPHNYYLEILSELGIVGFALIFLILIKLIHIFFKMQNNSIIKISANSITPFALLFFVEIFPLKTTGSFFTTGNASYIFLLIAVMVGLLNKLSYNKRL